MYKIEVTNRFKQSIKRLKKRRYKYTYFLYDVIDKLSKGEILPAKYKNHPLKGILRGYYDCHISPDLVLIYKIEKDRLVLLLFDIETHSNLF